MTASGPDYDSIEAGDEIPAYVRTTDLANWNRYAAANDEFIPIHMDDEDGRAVGQKAAFGMGNLRISYLHNALQAWLGDAGGIVEFGCQFRGLNFKGDTLTATATVSAKEVRDGARLVHLAFSVRNQDGVDTTPGTATVQFWDGAPTILPEPAPSVPAADAVPGAHLTQAEIDMVGATSDPVTSWPVGANDIRKWALATHWPAPAPAAFLDEAVAAAGPWGGLVAPRELDPFAWMASRPWSGPWLRGMGTEPGKRVLNGGQRNLYFAPIRPGDVITGSCRLADVVEKEMKFGPTAIFTTEQRWSNQDGALVRLGFMTSLYY